MSISPTASVEENVQAIWQQQHGSDLTAQSVQEQFELPANSTPYIEQQLKNSQSPLYKQLVNYCVRSHMRDLMMDHLADDASEQAQMSKELEAWYAYEAENCEQPIHHNQDDEEEADAERLQHHQEEGEVDTRELESECVRYQDGVDVSRDQLKESVLSAMPEQTAVKSEEFATAPSPILKNHAVAPTHGDDRWDPSESILAQKSEPAGHAAQTYQSSLLSLKPTPKKISELDEEAEFTQGYQHN